MQNGDLKIEQLSQKKKKRSSCLVKVGLEITYFKLYILH